ncbi:Unknown protein [Striga hermonthica]|uniref:Uncharacterized protein n=1 Tax=Striga hermonthica TaxID=68872 RepID=A0A9N7RK79_STRHE|nr:Unknown protein [Striga hermonthica]
MSLAAQAIFTDKNPTLYHTKPSKQYPFSPPNPKSPVPVFGLQKFSQPHIFPVCRKINAAFDEPYGPSRSLANANDKNSFVYSFDLDGFLSFVEFLSLASSAAISVYMALSCGALNGSVFGNGRILLCQCVLLVSGASVGAVIRRRQWRRIGGTVGFSRGAYGHGANLLGRVEKLEDDLRGSATIVRVLSRQIEKLGIRVRATRKAIKEPISETAALAMKNSEETRALAAQEDILEKELGEIQKVLLAMQNSYKIDQNSLKTITYQNELTGYRNAEHLINGDSEQQRRPKSTETPTARQW